MHAKRFAVLFLFLILTLSTVLAQKADVAFTVGASSVSDAQRGCPLGALCILPNETVKTDRQVLVEGTVGLRLVNAELASIHFEVPFAGVPDQTVRFSTVSSASTANLSSIYVTPSLRAKFLPGAFLSPWVSVGGGVAHFSLPNNTTTKGALQFGGGADLKTPVPHLALRLEVRDFLSGQPNFGTQSIGPIGSGLDRHNVFAGGGIVFRF